MDALVALAAGMLNGLRGLAPAACPGEWAWAVTMLGVLVGLLPTAGAVAVAIVRRRIGSSYGPAESVLLGGIGVLSAGLLPLAAFIATGSVFSAATEGQPVPGLTTAATGTIRTTECSVVGTQSSYLGKGTVADAVGGGDAVQSVIAIALLGVVPLLAVLLVAVQARTALRRGPKWPAKFFWIPLFSLVLLTAGVPSGTAEHLWIGILGASLVGVVLTAMVPPPSRAVIAAGERRRIERANPPPTGSRPATGAGPSGPHGAAAAPAGNPGLADRLAGRFAARNPETPSSSTARRPRAPPHPRPEPGSCPAPTRPPRPRCPPPCHMRCHPARPAAPGRTRDPPAASVPAPCRRRARRAARRWPPPSVA